MIIAPSLLASDHACFRERRCPRGHGPAPTGCISTSWTAISSPNISFGPQVVKAVRPYAKNLFFDVHLMCSRPDILLEPFARAGADEMIIHVELGEQQVRP